MCRPHHLGDLAESRRRRHDPLADDRVLANELPLVVGQGSRLVEHGVRDRHLADVVQLGRLPQPVQPVLWETEPLADALGELGDLGDVRAEERRALVLDADESVRGLARRRGAALLLERVHPQVRCRQHVRRGACLVGKHHRAVRCADREAFAGLGERLGAERRDAVRRLEAAQRREHAELVAAEPVRASPALQRGVELLPEPAQQRVAG